jgi:hypothetical protein
LRSRAVACEQCQGAGAAPGGELAQVQGVGLAGQPAVPGQEPGEGEPFGIGEGRLDRGEGGGSGSCGHRAPPDGAETRRLGELRIPAIERKPKVSRCLPSRHVTAHRKLEPPTTGETLQTADYGRLTASITACLLRVHILRSVRGTDL